MLNCKAKVAFHDIIMIRGSCEGRRKRVTRVDKEKERGGGERTEEGKERRKKVDEWSANATKRQVT